MFVRSTLFLSAMQSRHHSIAPSVTAGAEITSHACFHCQISDWQLSHSAVPLHAAVAEACMHAEHKVNSTPVTCADLLQQ